jgi:amino acid adenylation domain-containing protein
MKTVELLSNLRHLDVKLWVEGERLRYSAPPKTLNPELIAQLAAHKTEIINLLTQVRTDPAAAPPIQPVDRRQVLPLSFAQQRLWILDRLTPNSSAYHIPVVLRLQGSLDVEALRLSINEIVKRHEALRTIFTVENGEPQQTILPELEVVIPLVDVSERAGSDREAELEKLAAESSHRTFDLEHGPLLRAVIVKLDDEDHALCVTLHHIISDGWSSGNLIREFASCYEAFSAGRIPTLPPLKVQYADFAVWQREWLQGDVKEKQLAYWRKQLGENLPVLELPTVKSRPLVQTFGGATEAWQLSRALTDSINELSRQQNTTLFMVLLAAFKVLLSRYSGQEDIVVGTPIANRNRGEIEPLIGFFVNTLVLRTDLSGDPSFSDLLRRVREQTLGAYAHQDLPFELLVDELQPRREVNRTPLFQVVFVMQNAPFQPLRLPRLTMALQPLENLTAKFDLTLSARENESGLTLGLEYNTDLFDSAIIKRMLQQFEVLLQGVVHNSGLEISRLPLLPESERKKLLTAAQVSAAHYQAEKTLHDLFEERAAAVPGATAVVGEGVELTYEELNLTANRLANRLRRLGVGPESLVSICLERSEALVPAILGVLKAGGAYVPLDPASPPERLSFLLEDTRSPVLITKQPLLDRVPRHSAQLLLLDADRELIAAESAERPPVKTTPDNLAYVIYTSGSTGKPKGTLVTHYNVTRLFQATQSWFNFSEHDVWTLFHSYAFDFSVWEIWGALLYGGKLVIVPYTTSRSPAAFYELLKTQQLTVLNQTPSAFRQLIQAEEESGQSPELKLRLIIFGGEALELQTLKPWFERHGDTRPQPVNMYGITETTVHVTYRPLRADDLTTAPGSVIGCAIPDLQVYVLDKHMQPVPIAAPGEMYIGGAGVSRGYLNRPDLAAQRFVPDPFSATPGQRLYRSGDLARILPGGDIEYLGRLDQQVKIRGHRIELGEIEANLDQHPGIRHSVVVARDDAATNFSRLIAYVVPRDAGALNVDELRRWLKRSLPDYMIPAQFVMLQSLPLTANGKVDYKALPDTDGARPELGEDYVAPRTETEKALADVWAEVLRVERVGINDNFFDLGGDSIHTIQVHAKSAQRGLQFPLHEFFRCQTIAELAAVTESALPGFAAPASTAFSLLSEMDAASLPGDVEDAYPLAMLQTGMIFHSEYSASSTAYLNVSSIHLRTVFDRQALQAALKQLTKRHPILRASYDLTSYTEPLQLVHRDAEIDLQIEDLRTLSSAEQDEVIATWVKEDQGRAFDLSRAPLLRFQVHLRSDETFQLSWTEHHVILDGWSVASMLTELFQFYFSFVGKHVAPVLPPPQATFRDFIARERETLASEEAQSYWNNKLSQRNVLELPRRAASAGDAIAQQTKQSFSITPELSASLKRLASSAGVPLKAVLLAAHLKVLSVLGNQRDVLTGLVSNGRLEETDGERVLGLFLNTVPFRLQLRGGSWLELIRETFLAEQELLPFRRYPVAELQRQYGSGIPLFETMFNFTHFHVYQNLREISALEILDIQSIATTNYPLAADFSLDVVTGDIQFRLEYNTAKRGDSDIETVGGYYLAAFEAMARDPGAQYLAHPLLSAKEQLELRELGAGVRRAYSPAATVHGLFEEQVLRTPLAEALCYGEKRLTYEELNTRAERLAHRLQHMGVGPESRVGVLMNRSADLIVALLGVLKAGGCYVPLDPTYPSERLNYIFNDAQMSVLLTQSAHANRFKDCETRVLILDRSVQQLEACEMRHPSAVESNLAYVIYTSGSTGQPKGVAIEHRSAAVFVHWARETFGEDLLRSVLASTSVCFDLSIFEIFVPLSCGGRVVVAENVLQLPELPQVNEVSLINTVPSAMTELLRLGRLPESVMAVNLAGEALKEELVEAVYASSNARSVYNLYGPSEDTTYSTYTLVSRGCPVTIGRPVANTVTYILNESLQMVPAGVAGEIFIGGDGLARGYLDRPALTAEKFIPNPFSERFGARLYRTGDLGRYLPGGEIEFLGRLDHQVKIRGFRIEIGEIESVLMQHHQVRESVVLAREDVPGDKRLVAYVVSANGDPPSAGSLREHLKTKLPDYMIPAAFVTLGSLPLTPNGKINRKELPAPDVSAVESSGSYLGPRNALELKLTRVWENTLGVQPIGIKDNFFDLGGNSLVAVRLIAQIRKDFGEKVPINALFQSATIEQLAHNLHRPAESESEFSLVPIQPSGSRPPLFCVHPIGGSVFCYFDLSKKLGNDQPVYGLQAPGLYGEREPIGRIEDLASHYLKAVREVQPQGPYHLGGWSMGGVVAFEMAQQLRASGEEVAFLALIDSAVPKPLERLGDPHEEDAKLLAGFLRDLGAQAGKPLPDISERLRRVDAQEQIVCLLEEAAAQGILPPDTDAAQLESLLRVFKVNVQALSSYVPQSYEGSLVLIRALEGSNEDRFAGWSNLAESVETYSIPGNHYTVLKQPHVQTLATLLSRRLRDDQLMAQPAKQA